MSKEEFNQFIGVFILLIIITFLKRWFEYAFALVWLGVLIGYYLPFLDHLFYAYIIRPGAEVSRNIRKLITVRNLFSIKRNKALVNYVNETKDQRDRLIIHTAYFQMVFALLTFFILSSSSSLFARGLVFGFSLKLFVEEVFEFYSTKKISKWFSEMPISLDTHKTKVYLYANVLVLLIFVLML